MTARWPRSRSIGGTTPASCGSFGGSPRLAQHLGRRLGVPLCSLCVVGPSTDESRRSTRARLEKPDLLLDAACSAPEASLDNRQDPLDEAICIKLGFQADLERVKKVWTHLCQVLLSWEDLNREPFYLVAQVLRTGGLHHQEAAAIKHLLQEITTRSGVCSLVRLRHLGDEHQEHVLTQLLGQSWEGARCAMLCGLCRNALPVDADTFAVFMRVGVIPAESVYRRQALHVALQRAVQSSRRWVFYINLVVHSQRTCVSRRQYVVRLFCVMNGLPDDMKITAGGESKNEGAVPYARARA